MSVLRSMLSATFVVIFLTGCSLVPTKYDEVQEGQWEAKVLVKDHENSKSYIVKMDAFAVRNQSLRIDVTAALGTPVASLVLLGDDVKYVLPRKKSYYEGKSSERVLKPILSVPVDPKLFYSMLFDIVPADESWSCEKSEQGFLTSCKHDAKGPVVDWKDRKGRKKSVYIKHKKASLQMNVTWFKPSIETDRDVFSLNAPKKYKKFRIR